MMKRNEILKTISLGIAVLCGLFLFGKGVYHSFRKHRIFDTAATIAFPPFGIFRGVESFYHKDSKKDFINDADKEKAKIAILKLLSNTPRNEDDENKLDQAAEEVSRLLTNYNEDAVSYLKGMSQMYMRLHAAMSEDMNDLMIVLMDDAASFEPSGWYKKSGPVMDSLVSIYFPKENTDDYKQLDSVLVLIKNKITEKDINLKEKISFLNGLSNVIQKEKTKMGKRYRTIFKDPPPLEGY